jgi:hypothetical protein
MFFEVLRGGGAFYIMTSATPDVAAEWATLLGI